MALPGQRFNLDLDSENWKFDVQDNEATSTPDVISNIQERESTNIPAAPTLKSSKTGFPEHRPKKISAFKQQRQDTTNSIRGPSDKAILQHAVQKRGVDLSSMRDKAAIDAENKQRIQSMSIEDLEEARSELMARFKPDKLRAFLARANVDDEQEQQQKEINEHEAGRIRKPDTKSVSFVEPAKGDDEGEDDDESFQPAPTPATTATTTSSTHFPAPPRRKEDFKPLDPNSDTFLDDLREQYFPEMSHKPEMLSWLRDPSTEEATKSAYNPDRAGFAPSALRFDFKGNLVAPNEALEIPTSQGLHHHGDDPHSAGYTIPELTLLARSTLPNQRSVAHQVMGRILYRLGRGDFGPRGSEMAEGLWTCIERERIVEVIMAEANKDGRHVHQTAKAHATDALWLWRRGGGGDRGVLKEGERRAT